MLFVNVSLQDDVTQSADVVTSQNLPNENSASTERAIFARHRHGWKGRKGMDNRTWKEGKEGMEGNGHRTKGKQMERREWT